MLDLHCRKKVILYGEACAKRTSCILTRLQRVCWLQEDVAAPKRHL